MQAHKFKTYEVDDSMVRTIVKHAMKPSRIKGLAARAARAERNAKIVELLQEGEKHAVVAAQFGLSDNMVSTIARRAGLPPVRVVKKKLAAEEAALFAPQVARVADDNPLWKSWR